MHHRFRHRPAALLLALALTTAAAGCGSSTSTDGGPTTTTIRIASSARPATPTTAAAPTTVGTASPVTTAAISAAPTTTAGGAKTTVPSTPTTPTTSTGVTTTTAPGTDPGTLAQTDEKPVPEGAQWDTSTAGLWDAIVADDPTRALAFFFPLTAYRQVKGISDPDGDYQKRLIAYYEDDIHRLHTQLGDSAATAQFVQIEVPATAQWIKPGVEYNKGAYWRVFDSKLVYEVGGQRKTMLVKSMISWRGQWYVVHLSSVR